MESSAGLPVYKGVRTALGAGHISLTQATIFRDVFCLDEANHIVRLPYPGGRRQTFPIPVATTWLPALTGDSQNQAIGRRVFATGIDR